MPDCPACGRPVALARPTCLYCGAPLPGGAAAAAAAERDPLDGQAAGTGAAPGEPRVLVVLDLSGASAAALLRAGFPAYEAALLARRGGLHLHRVLDAEAAAEVTARLDRGGVAVVLVPEDEARLAPLRVASGERREGRLLLRGAFGLAELSGAELLLVVTGPIAREQRPRLERQKVETARLEPGWLVHLHRRAEPRPLEIDAADFSPGFAVTGSVRLEIEAWLGEIAAGVPRDDGFRSLPPVLAPAEPAARGPLAAAATLQASRSRPPRRRRTADDEPLLLDNVAQFRFYSAWRAAVERRRRGSPPSGAAC